MSATTTTVVPTGRWTLDPVHSSANFSVKHMMVATFRGRFEEFDVTLDATGSEPRLEGTVKVDSLVVKDENLAGHLRSPDFFDTERYPEIRFVSTDLRRDGDELIVDGELTVRDQTHAVQARGTITDPHTNIRGSEGIGLTLETIIDRTQFGLNWNAELPKGGYALGNDVKLEVELELGREEA